MDSWKMCKDQESFPSFTNKFVCAWCRNVAEKAVDTVEKLCDEVETVNSFCYLGDKSNASGRCETAATGRTRLGYRIVESAVKCLTPTLTFLKFPTH